jgi:hypothetical protein
MVLDDLTDGVHGPMAHLLVHISFMKSGHHITANNIANTYAKMLAALGGDFVIDVTDIGEVLALGCYYGCHPADQRFVAAMSRYQAMLGNLSFAIARRIAPYGPGTVSVHLLSLVLYQLNQIQFFEFLNRTKEYAVFQALYERYRTTSYLEVPYADFMYGESRPESVAVKQAIAPMYAYASALAKVMPGSTLNDSIALARDSRAAASNTIVASLEVQSFVRSYRSHLNNLVRSQLIARMPARARKAITGGEADEEESS